MEVLPSLSPYLRPVLLPHPYLAEGSWSEALQQLEQRQTPPSMANREALQPR